MAEPLGSGILEYGKSRHQYVRRGVLAAIAGALGGLLALCFDVLLRAGGPMLPVTLVFAPVSVLAEARAIPESAFRFALLVGGPSLFIVYAFLFSFGGSGGALARYGAIVFHLLCLAIAMLLKLGRL